MRAPDRWVMRWKKAKPETVRLFRADFERTLCYPTADRKDRRRVRTNNPAKRFIGELNRKLKLIGAFANEQSSERTTYLVWQHRKLEGYPNSSKSVFARRPGPHPLSLILAATGRDGYNPRPIPVSGPLFGIRWSACLPWTHTMFPTQQEGHCQWQ